MDLPYFRQLGISKRRFRNRIQESHNSQEKMNRDKNQKKYRFWLEMRGIDPRTSRMLSERSTI